MTLGDTIRTQIRKKAYMSGRRLHTVLKKIPGSVYWYWELRTQNPFCGHEPRSVFVAFSERPTEVCNAVCGVRTCRWLRWRVSLLQGKGEIQETNREGHCGVVRAEGEKRQAKFWLHSVQRMSLARSRQFSQYEKGMLKFPV
jgi:hypothetical protein